MGAAADIMPAEAQLHNSWLAPAQQLTAEVANVMQILRTRNWKTGVLHLASAPLIVQPFSV